MFAERAVLFSTYQYGQHLPKKNIFDTGNEPTGLFGFWVLVG